MRIIVTFAPYILIPLILAFLFKRTKGGIVYLTYIITAVLLFFYPVAYFMLDDYFNPPPPGPRCGNPQMGFFFANIIFFIPITLGVQLLFNFLLGLHKVKRKD
jgi:hypothetical protein